MSSTASSTRRPEAAWQVAAGWSIVAINAAAASLWAFWGAIASFHEGWHSPRLATNLLTSLAYLGPALLWTGLGLFALRWPRVGAAAYTTVGFGLAAWITREAHFGTVAIMLGGFAAVFGALWWYGRPRPMAWAYRATWALPAVVALASGAAPAYRVATRFDDGGRGMRVVNGNGVTLTWAPRGPGWPRRGGFTWAEAVERCRRLETDGLTLAEAPVDVWRLPTVEEVVRSLTRDGENAGGTWNEATGRAAYTRAPDKESPLWDPHSPVIYWWAADEAEPGAAYRVVYTGRVFAKPKGQAMGSQGFRAVRNGVVSGDGSAGESP